MTTIFISYAHVDVELKDEIESVLKLLALKPSDVGWGWEVWSDRGILAGDDWEAKIETMMERASVAVLVVTEAFLASEYIQSREIPHLESRHEAGGLRVIPIIADVCPWEAHPFLNKLEHRPKGKNSLEQLSPVDRKLARKELYFEIAGMLNVPLEEPSAMTAPRDAGRPSTSSPVANSSSYVSLRFAHDRLSQYRLELRYGHWSSPDLDRVLHAEAKIDLAALRELEDDHTAYARELRRRVLPPGAPSELIDGAMREAGSDELRVRVSIEPSANDLHSVCWEKLPMALAFDDPSRPTIQFSRYVSAGTLDWPDPLICSWPEARVALFDLRSTVGTDLRAFEDVFQAAGFSCHQPEPRSDPATLEHVHAPIVFLAIDVVEGSSSRPTVRMPDGALVPAARLAEGLRKHGHHTQVMILHTDSPVSLVDIAAELVTTGVCAVTIQQEKMQSESWLRFLGSFLSALAETGNVDRATHLAREGFLPELRESESWKPAVFTRLRTGQIWFKPGFVGQADPWDLVVSRVKKGTIIPILGPGVSQYLIRSKSEIARRLAAQHSFPLAQYESSNLRKVAQYIATMKERDQVVDQFVDTVRDYARDRYGPGPDPDEDVLQALERSWREVISKLPDDPYRMLARLEAPIYLTTAFHQFLSLSVQERLRDSSEGGLGARDRILTLDRGILNVDQEADEGSFRLSGEEPMIYSLFGRIDYPKTLVLTEDDHFRFLLNFKEHWRSLPPKVMEKFSDSALLFLGFDLESWDFRALFRGFLELEGSNQMWEMPHVAVQISPDDHRLGDPERTREYLDEYFRQISKKPLIFLGSTQDFLRELVGRLG